MGNREYENRMQISALSTSKYCASQIVAPSPRGDSHLPGHTLRLPFLYLTVLRMITAKCADRQATRATVCKNSHAYHLRTRPYF
jgi:hypothetical protein